MSTKRLTQKEVELRVRNKHGEKITVLGVYKSLKTKIDFRCNKCNNIFNTLPESIINGHGCPRCANNQPKSESRVAKEVLDVGKGDYEYLGGYKNTHSKIRLKHNFCGHEFEMVAKAFIRDGQRCPKHQYERSSKSNTLKGKDLEKREKEIERIADIDNYKVLKNYKKSNEKLILLCLECESKYKVTPYEFVSKRSQCACRVESKGEKAIREFLDEESIDHKREYTFSDCRGIRWSLPFDFAVFDKEKLCFLIEFDGLQHYEPKFGKENFERTLKNDEIKNNYCDVNKIPLVRVKYNRKIKYESFKGQVITELIRELVKIKETIPSQAIQKWIEGVETNANYPNV